MEIQCMGKFYRLLWKGCLYYCTCVWVSLSQWHSNLVASWILNNWNTIHLITFCTYITYQVWIWVRIHVGPQYPLVGLDKTVKPRAQVWHEIPTFIFACSPIKPNNDFFSPTKTYSNFKLEMKKFLTAVIYFWEWNTFNQYKILHLVMYSFCVFDGWYQVHHLKCASIKICTCISGFNVH